MIKSKILCELLRTSNAFAVGQPFNLSLPVASCSGSIWRGRDLSPTANCSRCRLKKGAPRSAGSCGFLGANSIFFLSCVQLVVDILDFNSNIIQYSFVSCTIKLNSFPDLFFWEAASCKPVSSRAKQERAYRFVAKSFWTEQKSIEIGHVQLRRIWPSMATGRSQVVCFGNNLERWFII